MAQQAEEKPKKAESLVNKVSNGFAVLFLGYFAFVANSFRSILWPKFPDIHPQTHEFIPRFGNIIEVGDNLTARVWVGTTAWPAKKAPLAEFTFIYDWDKFQPLSRVVNASISQAQLKKGDNMILSVEVKHKKSGNMIRAKGGLVKSIKQPETPVKFSLLSRSVCPEQEEPMFDERKKTHIARGIPQMQVRLVFDETAYPNYIKNGPYLPSLFVDEFWMTDDKLVKLNTTGVNRFDSEIHVALMSAARWRFQHHMQMSFEQNAKVFGEGSEEMLQVRDLFANTHPYLLAVTMVVSVLHMLFEFLAFKNDVQFWQGCDPAMISKYLSVQSILVGIVMETILVLFLYEQESNIIVLGTSVVGIAVEIWKVQRVMKFHWVKIGGFLPFPLLASKVHVEKKDDFDTQAMKWLALILSPGILGFCIYTLVYDCYRSWYSYFISASASCVYSLGFILMTPQVFINYKHKTVAYLPWRKFVYRAFSTFIDDLFALIIRMPTMHRLSCFRDDIVFFIYLYQRHLYPVDKCRTFDEDGYALPEDQVASATTNAEEKKDQ